MRNGICDSNHRGVWFYLHWDHPWPADSTEIVVEIEVAQSSIHSNSKWHHKYCASGVPAAAINELVRVHALHIPERLMGGEFVNALRFGQVDYLNTLT